MCRHPCRASTAQLPRTKDPIEIPRTGPAPGRICSLTCCLTLILCFVPLHTIFILRSRQRVSICTTFILDPSSIFVFVKFKHATLCIRMIETFFRLRCSNIRCLPRFFVPCDIQTFPGSAKKDKYLRPSLFVLMMMMMGIWTPKRGDERVRISSL